jgi:ABC-type Fe3+ transport system permease subunit
VISAQAEPMVRPYVETNPPQIHGLVIGLSGGASFEDLNGRNGLGQAYWNAFSLGLVAAALLILVGAVVTAGSAVWARTKETEGEKKA